MTTRNRLLCGVGTLAFAWVAGPGNAAEPASQDFAYGATLQVPAEAAAYRFALPTEVYQKIVHADLSDLRIFNGRGESTPVRLLLPSRAQAPRSRDLAVSLFPLRGDSEPTVETLRVTIGERGSTLHVQTEGAASPAAKPTRYLLDARSVASEATAIIVQWSPDAADFAGKLSVQASDTLDGWRTVVSAAPIANLHANGQQLVEQKVALPATRAKYWQLAWVGAAAPFELVSASIETAEATPDLAYSRLVVTGKAVADHPGEFEFDLGALAPTERINLELPVLNTVVGAELLSRPTPNGPWRSMLRSVFYRLSSNGGQLRNGPLEVPTTSDRYWLVRIAQSGNLGAGAPRLEAQWRAHELTFLARGGGPYLLAFGSSAVTTTGPSFDSLPANTPILDAIPASVQSLGGPERLLAARAPFPWKTTVLWGVLILGVTMLAVMAYRLSRSVGNTPG